MTHCEAARQGLRDIMRALPELQRNGSNINSLAAWRWSFALAASFPVKYTNTAFSKYGKRQLFMKDKPQNWSHSETAKYFE